MVFRIAPLLRFIAIMTDEKVPPHCRILRCERVECWHLVIGWQTRRRHREGITTRLENDDTLAGFGEAGGQGPATRARADSQRRGMVPQSERLQELGPACRRGPVSHPW